MDKSLQGKVTEEEKAEIQALFERKNGLTELAKILPSNNDEMYERVVKDLGATTTAYQSWWDKMSSKYQWKKIETGHWEIDFYTNEVFLVE